MRNTVKNKTLWSALVAVAALCISILLAQARNQSNRPAEAATQACPNDDSGRSPMPPMGGAQLIPDQVSALASYVWGLSHRESSNRN